MAGRRWLGNLTFQICLHPLQDDVHVSAQLQSGGWEYGAIEMEMWLLLAFVSEFAFIADNCCSILAEA